MSSLLGSLFIVRPLEDALHVDARGMNALRVDLPRLHEALHLRDRQARRRGHDRVEIARRLAVLKIAEAIAPVRLHQGKIRGERGFQHVMPLSEAPGLLPLPTVVPYPVGVKKAAMPAPPARMRSENVPCGTSSTRSSPLRNWCSNRSFSPT